MNLQQWRERALVFFFFSFSKQAASHHSTSICFASNNPHYSAHTIKTLPTTAQQQKQQLSAVIIIYNFPFSFHIIFIWLYIFPSYICLQWSHYQNSSLYIWQQSNILQNPSDFHQQSAPVNNLPHQSLLISTLTAEKTLPLIIWLKYWRWAKSYSKYLLLANQKVSNSTTHFVSLIALTYLCSYHYMFLRAI